MASQAADSLTLLAKLAAEVDRGFAEIHDRRRSAMECRAGCSDCCRARLSITRVEERRLREALARLPEADRSELARRARDPEREMCPALDADGRCQLYENRPLICRSFGAPLRHRGPVALVRPPVVDVCDLNFVEISLDSLPAEDVLEQTALTGRLEAINDAYCERNGYDAKERIGIAQILESLSSGDEIQG